MGYNEIGNRFHNSTSDIRNRCVLRSMFPYTTDYWLLLA